MTFYVPQYAYILLISLSEIFGDFALEKYANTGLQSALSFGIAGYIAVIFFLVQALHGSSILYVNGMWDGTSALLESLAALFILGERLPRTEQYIGLILIVAGICLLSVKKGDIMRNPWK